MDADFHQRWPHTQVTKLQHREQCKQSVTYLGTENVCCNSACEGDLGILESKIHQHQNLVLASLRSLTSLMSARWPGRL